MQQSGLIQDVRGVIEPALEQWTLLVLTANDVMLAEDEMFNAARLIKNQVTTGPVSTFLGATVPNFQDVLARTSQEQQDVLMPLHGRVQAYWLAASRAVTFGVNLVNALDREAGKTEPDLSTLFGSIARTIISLRMLGLELLPWTYNLPAPYNLSESVLHVSEALVPFMGQMMSLFPSAPVAAPVLVEPEESKPSPAMRRQKTGMIGVQPRAAKILIRSILSGITNIWELLEAQFGANWVMFPISVIAAHQKSDKVPLGVDILSDHSEILGALTAAVNRLQEMYEHPERLQKADQRSLGRLLKVCQQKFADWDAAYFHFRMLGLVPAMGVQAAPFSAMAILDTVFSCERLPQGIDELMKLPEFAPLRLNQSQLQYLLEQGANKLHLLYVSPDLWDFTPKQWTKILNNAVECYSSWSNLAVYFDRLGVPIYPLSKDV